MGNNVSVQMPNSRSQRLERLEKSVAYTLFGGVMLVVLQAFFNLTLVGKITNSVQNNSHFMHYSQFYLRFCAMLLTALLFAYYVIKIFIALDRRAFVPAILLQDNLILLPFVFMLIWALISTFKSPYFDKSLNGAGYINEGYYTVLQYAVIFLSVYSIRNDIKFAKSAILWTFIILAGIICIVFVGIEITGYEIPTSLMCGVFNNSNHYGYFLAMSCSATFGAMVFANKKWQFWIAGVLLPFNVFELFACNTLGANIAYIAAICFIVCSGLITKKLDWKRLLFACAISAIMTLIIEACGRTNMWASYVQLFKDIKKVIAPGDGETGGDDNAAAGTGRFGLWVRTIAVIKRVPWFGKGLDLYHANNIYDPTLDVSHNEYLTMASNIGVPGLVMYMATVVWWFARAVRLREYLETKDLVIMATAFAYLISAIFGNSFTYTYPYFLVFFALSIQKVRWREENYKTLQRKNEFLATPNEGSCDII